MKIAYLEFVRLPTEKAHGLQMMKTCEALAHAGARVELVVPARRTKISGDPFDFYHVRRNFILTRVKVPDLVRYGALGFLISLLVFSERARWHKSFWESDAVYSRDYLVLLQYVLLGRPLVFEAHAKPNALSAFVARRASRVIVISRALQEAYVARGVDAKRIVLAPDAVDIGQFSLGISKEEARAKLGFENGRYLVAYTGHLYARKGAQTLARAALLLPDVAFAFVGGTDKDVASFRERWGSAKNIRIEGYVAPQKVPCYLRAADALVLPNSANDEDSARFTSPMKLFEYLASGTPVVASDVPSVREVLDESTALFVAPDDPEALAHGVERVLNDSNAISRAHTGKRLAERYSWAARAHAILSGLDSSAQAR
ncbi:MAG TPA: glycosyltransferase family 4 protein [Candidatus Paceibacterota bacterium]|nr:glycosyltransferase family 4 protein [Candidatus Paceibacterota bacterium]